MKRSELDIVWNLILKGKTKKEIREKLNLESNALSNHLAKLERLGCIRREGKFLIHVLSSSPKYPRVTKNILISKLNKRTHAFNIKVYFPQETEGLWNKPKVKSEYKQKTIERLKFGSYKLIKDHTSIWINKETLTFYSNNSYYSQNALHGKFMALKDIDSLIIYLKDRFGFKGQYGIEVFREHYGLIFNKFATWLLNQNRKLQVKEKGNKLILWVDDSMKDDIGYKEFEGDNPIRINKADETFKEWDEDNYESIKPKNIKKIKEELNETQGLLAEFSGLLKQSSKGMVDSELRNKQLENRLNGFEELFLQIINKLNDDRNNNPSN